MAFLRQARVRVFWGSTNLSNYNGSQDFPKDQPVVYDVDVNLQGETQGPTAQMKWDPTGKGMALYEYFTSSEELMATQIKIDIYYPAGKSISFLFVWSGQSISYGNDMTITVKMQSELAGLINANQRSIAYTDGFLKGVPYTDTFKYAGKQFDTNKVNTGVVGYTKKALIDAEKVKVSTVYALDTTNGALISNLAQQGGNMAFASNIGKAEVILYTPYSIDKDSVVKNGVTEISAGSGPDPKERYGYLLGPSIIQTLTRSVEWRPPQQTNSITPNTQTRALPPRNEKGQFTKAEPKPEKSVKDNQTPTAAPLGTSGGRSTPGFGNFDNPDQVKKQNALNEEKSSTMSMTTYLTPALVGIKPHDILYIPSYKGNYMEDWIVQSVDYNQSDGKVDIGIQATRAYGSGVPMNEKNAAKFKSFAESNGLIGPNATLENWDKYAWGMVGSSLGGTGDSIASAATAAAGAAKNLMPGAKLPGQDIINAFRNL
jgi:hypothetical protein